MDLSRYSVSQDYELEFIPDDLGFFQKKSYIKEKISEKNDNTLIFIEKNKILSVEVEDDMIGWFQYEKARFFYSLFIESRNYKYILISENDSFFYGFIDGFPCIFKSDYEEIKQILKEYSDDEFIAIFCVGKSELDYISKKTLKDVWSLFNIEEEDLSNNCVMENGLEYGENICGSLEFSQLCFYCKELTDNYNYNCKKNSMSFFCAGFFFLMFSFFVKNFC